MLNWKHNIADKTINEETEKNLSGTRLLKILLLPSLIIWIILYFYLMIFNVIQPFHIITFILCGFSITIMFLIHNNLFINYRYLCTKKLILEADKLRDKKSLLDKTDKERDEIEVIKC